MAFASSFFRLFEIEKRVNFLVPDVSYAHSIKPGRVVAAHRDLETTIRDLGKDGAAWRALMEPLVKSIDGVIDFSTSNLLRLPRDLVGAAKFAMRVIEQGTPAHGLRFSEIDAPALLAGVNAHAIGRMPRLETAAVGLMLGALAHTSGWPIPHGGSQAIVNAMISDLRIHGGTIETGVDVLSMSDLEPARATFFDVSPRALHRILGGVLPESYRRSLERFRYGDGVAKMDFALSGPVPWSGELLRKSPTIHLGGTRDEIANSESEVSKGIHPENPYILINQPSLIDDSRAPIGKQVLWAYTHVPHGSKLDMSESIIKQIEILAPGFRDTILAKQHLSADEMSQLNPNYVGGDISAGAMSLLQLIRRPVISLDPWRIPFPGMYICSSSTPPGTGVHGLSGLYAARSALRNEFNLSVPLLGLEQT
jgi:phytoene dehydrogenase-like protein